MKVKLLIIVGVVLSLGAFFIMPSDDDFYSLPAPHVLEDWSFLFPSGAFWRPIDAAWGILMGKIPGAFPYVNHLMVLLCYFFSLYGLEKILSKMSMTGITKQISLCFFLMSPALVATLYSVDSINQALSMALGIASVLLYGKHKVCAYLCIILSLFTKESGISWFLVTPLLNMVMEEVYSNRCNPNLKKYLSLFKPYMVSLLMILAYFVVRNMLRQPISEEDLGNYSSGLGLNSVMGLALLWGSSLTVIDTVSYFLEHNYILLLMTVLVSVEFLVVILKHLITSRNARRLRLVECLFVILILTLPHLVMAHPGEMHAYPTLWGVALSFGILFKEVKWSRIEQSCVVLFFVVGVLVYVHKGYYMYKIGEIANTRVKSAISQTHVIPRSVYILDFDEPLTEYSVFQTMQENCWDKGKGTRIYFDLKNPKTTTYKLVNHTVREDSLINEAWKSGKYDAIWIVKNNNVKVVDCFGERKNDQLK